ncbi:unnamed protein product [Anisakis simplex]|uniref:DC_STAMP domain-containing protein n=1 Tax=Anisakis simplex TaxID=6269 RepID=A0A158PP70_ANISI|nr:unnamed protein product [Anisakis simplex]
MRSLYDLLFVERYREGRRQALGRSKMADIFYYSGVYDYRILRYMINFPIGFVISYFLYALAWNRVNFADFDPLYEQLFKWIIIMTSSVTFAISPVYRCAIVCVLFGSLGKNGQGLLSVHVFTNLHDGPIKNIMTNFNLSSYIITCHLKLKEQLATERIVMSTGPIEAFLADKFGKSTTKGRKMVHMLKALVDPIAYDMTLSDEDKAIAATIDNAEVLKTRDVMLNEKKDSISNEDVKPVWNKLKSKTAKLQTMRLYLQCNEVFDKGIKKCHDKFRDMKSKCYNMLWFLPFLNRVVCGKFDVLHICQASEKHQEATRFCNEMMQGALQRSKSIDTDTDQMNNITEEVLDHLRVNMHYKAIVEPRITRAYRVKQVYYRISQRFHIIKVVFKTLKSLLGCLFIFLLYTLFRDSIQMIRNYLNNIDFKNVFLNSYFWRIDEKRQENGQVFLNPLSRAEWKANRLMKPFSPPTSDEIEASWQPLARFCIASVVCLLVMMVDYFFYAITNEVIRFTATSVTSGGKQSFHLDIKGVGFVADLVRDMVNHDFDQNVNLTIPSEQCRLEPSPPDWLFSWIHIILPLLLMLILQVIFGYFIKRLILFYVIGGIFRKRNKTRTIQLYNKLLFARVNGRRLARARIRYQVERHLLQHEAIAQQGSNNIACSPIMN